MVITNISYSKADALSPQAQNILGKSFGESIVVGYLGRSKKGSVWTLRCICGNTYIASTGALNEGKHKHCGCKYVNPAQTHKMSNTKRYGQWLTMKYRCINPKSTEYHRYGGRGIKICERWLKFENFWEDMGSTYKSGLTIERINTNGNYEPSNCKWATYDEQSRNKRNNHWIEYNGERKLKKDWAADFGVNYMCINVLLKKGYTFDQIYKHYTVNYHRYKRIKTEAL